jgi:outer membrane protein assembly factor BamB
MLNLGDLLQTLHNPCAGGGFGSSVAMSGDTAVVGAGDATYVFDAGTGDLRWTLSTPGGGPLGVSESIVAVLNMTYPRSVYIFDAATGGLIRTVTDADHDGLWNIGQARCVAVSGNTVVVGSYINGGMGEGSATAFDGRTDTLLYQWLGELYFFPWGGNHAPYRDLSYRFAFQVVNQSG